jgi:SAM-dependent methyltransferase
MGISHSHSHDGGGHSHGKKKSNHGHSHDDHHGHSHADHGHSHGGHDDHHGHSHGGHDDHGHSHGGHDDHGHSHGGHDDHGHSHGCGGHDDDHHGHSHGVVTFEDAGKWAAHLEAPGREEWQRPTAIIDEVLRPLLPPAAAGGAGGSPSQAVIAEVGCGTGYLLTRVAKALPSARVIGTDTEAGMVAYTADRCRTEGLANVEVVATPGAPARATLPARAHVIVLLTAYHHIDAATRVAWLRATAAEDLVQGEGGGQGGGGAIVIIEHKTGELPIQAPPPGMRLSRAQVEAEVAAAGLVVATGEEAARHQGLLPYHEIIVARRG